MEGVSDDIGWNEGRTDLYLINGDTLTAFRYRDEILGPVVQSVVSLTTSLRVISLAVLADQIHNILIFFAEKM